jgi:hypothetical protein
MEWDLALGMDALFIEIDFEKACDQVEWAFTLAMLKAPEFGPYFITCIKTLEL